LDFLGFGTRRRPAPEQQGDDVMMPLPPEPMTIEQLKAHMDRRFDRLERTKADRSELRRLAARVDRCATKADLKRFATKEYLKRFATKEDLKRFATKEELKAVFARLEDRVVAMQRSLQRLVDHHDRILNDHEARLVDLERHA
jgi:hypothetical protein